MPKSSKPKPTELFQAGSHAASAFAQSLREGDVVEIRTKGKKTVFATVKRYDDTTLDTYIVRTREVLPDGTSCAHVGTPPEECMANGSYTVRKAPKPAPKKKPHTFKSGSEEAQAFARSLYSGDVVEIRTRGQAVTSATVTSVINSTSVTAVTTDEKLPDGSELAYVGTPYEGTRSSASYTIRKVAAAPKPAAAEKMTTSTDTAPASGSEAANAYAQSLRPGDRIEVLTKGKDSVVAEVNRVVAVTDNPARLRYNVGTRTLLPDNSFAAFVGTPPESYDQDLSYTVRKAESAPMTAPKVAPAEDLAAAYDCVRRARDAVNALAPYTGTARPGDLVYHIPSRKLLIYDGSLVATDCVVVQRG